MPKRSKKERKTAKRREKLRRREEAAYRRQQRTDYGLSNPYSHEPDPEAKIALDLLVMREAWKETFGEFEEGFFPPWVVNGQPHPWVFVFKRLMTEKYGSLTAAAPRVVFMMNLVLNMASALADATDAEEADDDDDESRGER